MTGRKWEWITFNNATERFEMGGRDLTCGTCLTLAMDGKDYEARVEHDGNNYYAIIFPEEGKPFKASLFDWNMGKWQY